jgi:hypothetical protein
MQPALIVLDHPSCEEKGVMMAKIKTIFLIILDKSNRSD